MNQIDMANLVFTTSNNLTGPIPPQRPIIYSWCLKVICVKQSDVYSNIQLP